MSAERKKESKKEKGRKTESSEKRPRRKSKSNF
jgi:hypothetical protein